MKRLIPFLLCVSVVVPGWSGSETLHLKDGSVLNGRLVKAENDTLYFETSFGSTLAVHRGKVWRIDFGEGPAPSSGELPVVGSPVHPGTDKGTLSVTFDKFTLTSRIVVPRNGDRRSYEHENSIEQSLVVDEENAFSYVDSVTDKTVRNGPETTLRNDFEPRDFEVALSPGIHRCVLRLANSRASAYIERFDPAPIDRKLVLETVRIEPGKTTHVGIGVRRPSWLKRKTELYKIE